MKGFFKTMKKVMKASMVAGAVKLSIDALKGLTDKLKGKVPDRYLKTRKGLEYLSKFLGFSKKYADVIIFA